MKTFLIQKIVRFPWKTSQFSPSPLSHCASRSTGLNLIWGREKNIYIVHTHVYIYIYFIHPFDLIVARSCFISGSRDSVFARSLNFDRRKKKQPSTYRGPPYLLYIRVVYMYPATSRELIIVPTRISTYFEEQLRSVLCSTRVTWSFVRYRGGSYINCTRRISAKGFSEFDGIVTGWASAFFLWLTYTWCHWSMPRRVIQRSVSSLLSVVYAYNNFFTVRFIHSYGFSNGSVELSISACNVLFSVYIRAYGLMLKDVDNKSKSIQFILIDCQENTVLLWYIVYGRVILI